MVQQQHVGMTSLSLDITQRSAATQACLPLIVLWPGLSCARLPVGLWRDLLIACMISTLGLCLMFGMQQPTMQRAYLAAGEHGPGVHSQ